MGNTQKQIELAKEAYQKGRATDTDLAILSLLWGRPVHRRGCSCSTCSEERVKAQSAYSSGSATDGDLAILGMFWLMSGNTIDGDVNYEFGGAAHEPESSSVSHDFTSSDTSSHSDSYGSSSYDSSSSGFDSSF